MAGPYITSARCKPSQNGVSVIGSIPQSGNGEVKKAHGPRFAGIITHGPFSDLSIECRLTGHVLGFSLRQRYTKTFFRARYQDRADTQVKSVGIVLDKPS